MTDTPKGSDPAYPVPGHHLARGEDKREDFAKFALLGLLCQRTTNVDNLGYTYPSEKEPLCRAAVAYADALIAALAKK